MIFYGRQLSGEKERKEVEAMTKLSTGPAIFLVVLFIIMAYLTHFLAQQIVRPLNRFVNYSLKIAKGDFTPVKPAKKYKDEFSRLGYRHQLDDGSTSKKSGTIHTIPGKWHPIGTLTSGIAHELNNPLNNICITTESLIDDFEVIDEAEKRKRLHDVYTQAERASGTVRNLLDFTRMGQPAFVPLLSMELLRSVLNLSHHEMELHNVQLGYSPDDTPDARIKGDFSQLQQVF